MASLGQTLDDMGYEHNRMGAVIGYNADITDPEGQADADTVASGLDNGSTNVVDSIPISGLPGDKIEYLEVTKLKAGTIYSQKIFLSVLDGKGDTFIAAGKTDFTNTESGFILGIDDSDSNKPKFYIGSPTNYVNWDGATLTIAGSLVAGEIHIPDVDTTANSFHVESDGSGWIGATSSNRTTAPIQWTPAGVWDVGNGTTYMRLDGPNGVFKSSNYVAGVSGFQLTTGGAFEAENGKFRGSMYGTTFKYDVVSAVGGQLLVTNADSLSTAMTALDASTMTIIGNTTFAANDMLLIRALTGSGIQEEYLRVTSAASAPTYTVTRDLAGTYGANSNPAWGAGTAVVKIGESDGAATYSGGWLRLLGEGTNAPYYSVFSRTGVAYNAYSERARMGNLNGIGSIVTEAYGLFLGNYSAGQFLQYDDVSGNLIVNGSQLSNQALFGDGSDGDATISSPTSLTSDTFYDDLTVSSTLTTNGYRLFVRGILTVSVGGIIEWSGVAGGNGGNGGDAFTDATSATGGAAGAAGTAGTALTDGSIPGSLAGPAGGAGGAGVARTGGGNTAGNAGANGATGTNQAKCMVATASAGAAGGDSGDSNPTAFFGGQSGGTGGAAGTNTSTILNEIRNYISAYLLYDPQDGTWYNTSPGTGGGGGGASGAVSTGAYRGASGGGGGGGGAGSSGGTVAIFARILVNNGTIRAIGGNGGNGGNAGAASNNGGLSGIGGGGGGAGGSGGNGGVLVLVYSSYSGSGTTSVAAGSAGTGGSSAAGLGNGVGQGETNGTAGNAGVAGVSITLQV